MDIWDYVKLWVFFFSPEYILSAFLQRRQKIKLGGLQSFEIEQLSPHIFNCSISIN